MSRPLVTAEEARHWLVYEPETGVVRWARNRKGGPRAGDIAGNVRKDGYLGIGLCMKDYLLHRVIWLMVHGVWPEHFIDHINCNKSDNRLCNLREATKSENGRNRGPQRNNKSGFKGVCFDQHKGKWLATIKTPDKQHRLGHYRNVKDAAAAYVKATELHGEFRRLK